MLLIITACIKPSASVGNVVIRNDEIRLQQYMDALLYFLNVTEVTDIIFCDNSDAYFDYNNLYKQAKKKNKNLEILQFKQDDTMTATRGKSYGELCIMDYVLKNSLLIRNHDFFFKITGRLIIQNFNSIREKIDYNNNYFVCLGNPIDYKSERIDTRFYGMTRHDYCKLHERLFCLVDEAKGFSLEKSFFYGIKESGISYRMIPYYPRYIGISGSTGVDYSDIRCKRLKFFIKDAFIKVYDYKLKNEANKDGMDN